MYKLSKLTGEAACLHHANSKARVVRLSNVIGNDPRPTNFVPSLVHDALTRKKISLRSDPASTKDYIALEDVLKMVVRVSLEGRARLYNVASGCQHSHAEIVAEIQAATGCSVDYLSSTAAPLVYPNISVSRLQNEFDFQPLPILPLLRGLCLPTS